MKNFIQKNALYLFLFLIFVVIFLTFLLFKFVILNKEKTKTESEILVEKVSEIMFLPNGDIPSIATVTEPEKLQNQIFFENSKKGDKVLIYSKQNKAILYDPVAHKIVNVSSVSFDASLENNSNINQQEF